MDPVGKDLEWPQYRGPFSPWRLTKSSMKYFSDFSINYWRKDMNIAKAFGNARNTGRVSPLCDQRIVCPMKSDCDGHM